MATMEGHHHRNVAPLSLTVFSVDTGPLMHGIYCFRALLWCMPVPDKCRPPVKCVCLDQVCPHTLLAQLSPVRSVTARLRPSFTSNTCACTVT